MDLPNRPLVPGDLSELDEEPAQELGALFERALAEGDDRVRRTLRGLLIDRALRALRQGTRDDLQEESLLVSQTVSEETGEQLRERDPETFGAFSYLHSLLSEAGRRSDRAAVTGILRGTRGPAILELVASEGRPVRRSEILRRLGLDEAQLSHLLRDLEEAELIRRYRQGQNIWVELGPVGREVVETEILPAWTQRLLTEIDSVRRGRPTPPETFSGELEAAGAPSRTLASRLAEKLATLRFPDLRLAGEVRDSGGEEWEAEKPDAAPAPDREARVRAALAVLGTLGEAAADAMAESVRSLRSLPC